MPAERRPGMDHGWYRYEPLPSRPPLPLPGGARLALWVVLHLEHWELAAPEGAHTAPGVHGHWGRTFPDCRTYSHREYGNRIGFFRVLDVLDRHGIRATVAANAAACERYPELVDACRARGYEFAGSGTHATRMITSLLSEPEERAVIASVLDTIERTTGTRPVGWIGQDHGESARTPGLLDDAGLRYVADWPNDEQPYRMTTERGLVSLPRQPEWDDVQLLWLRQQPSPAYPRWVGAAFDRLWQEGAERPRTFEISVHPWLLGQAHRIRYLDEALAAARSREAVWHATGAQIAELVET